jgi:patched 1 protein
MFALGIYGMNKMEDGLELSDILVKGTPGYDFIVAREKYFSFYPMQAVIRGPTDLANTQGHIRQLREDILTKSPYTVGIQLFINYFY